MGGAGRRLALWAALGLLVFAIGWMLRDRPGWSMIRPPPTPAVPAAPSDGDARLVTAPSDAGAKDTERRASPSSPSRREADTDIPALELAVPPDYRQVFEALGLERDLDAWMATRRLPWDRSVELSYDGLPREALRRLASEGDPIARWVLARRLLYTAPLEANDLLRGLADDGVIAAIGRLSLHLRGLAQHRDRLARRWTDDARAGMAAWEAAGTDLRTEALAWGLLAESFEGLPRGTGVDRTWNATGEPPPELAIACERAAELHAQLEAAWAESGSAAVSVEASPVLFTVTADDAYLEACPADLLPTPSFDGCRPFRVRGGYEDELAFACPGD